MEGVVFTNCNIDSSPPKGSGTTNKTIFMNPGYYFLSKFYSQLVMSNEAHQDDSKGDAWSMVSCFSSIPILDAYANLEVSSAYFTQAYLSYNSKIRPRYLHVAPSSPAKKDH